MSLPRLPPNSDSGLSQPSESDPYAEPRRRMVETQLRARDIVDTNVLRVMGKVPRERFVEETLQEEAYHDYPLPIACAQTISQPYIVALMTQLICPTPKSRVLEIGVGSGYQTAILAELCREVYGLEILPPLAETASKRLAAFGYQNVHIRCADGHAGWPEYAPFDAILVAAAPSEVPQPLIDQLTIGGRLVIPVGYGIQELLLLRKRPNGSIETSNIAPVQFVPLTGQADCRSE